MNQLFVRGLRLKKSAADTESYAFSLPAVRQMERLEFSAPVTLLVGENGVGKSTLLEALAVGMGFNAEGGSQNFNFSTAQTHSPLAEHITVVKGIRRPADGFFLRAESFYNVASEVENLAGGDESFYQNYGGKSPHRQSHGESFLALALHRFRAGGLYILDEPEAALSPVRQMSLLLRIRELAARGSQFIIATHAPILMAIPGSELYVLSENGIEKTPYQQTEHFTVSRAFLQDPERMIEKLCEPDGDD